MLAVTSFRIARCLDLLNNFGHICPARFAGNFQMKNFDGKIGFSADSQSFFDACGSVWPLAAACGFRKSAVSRSNLASSINSSVVA